MTSGWEREGFVQPDRLTRKNPLDREQI
jgi:hypothetical protein